MQQEEHGGVDRHRGQRGEGGAEGEQWGEGGVGEAAAAEEEQQAERGEVERPLPPAVPQQQTQQRRQGHGCGKQHEGPRGLLSGERLLDGAIAHRPGEAAQEAEERLRGLQVGQQQRACRGEDQQRGQRGDGGLGPEREEAEGGEAAGQRRAGREHHEGRELAMGIGRAAGREYHGGE